MECGGVRYINTIINILTKHSSQTMTVVGVVNLVRLVLADFANTAADEQKPRIKAITQRIVFALLEDKEAQDAAWRLLRFDEKQPPR